MITDRQQQFCEAGFIGPISLYSTSECRNLLRRLVLCPKPGSWVKGNAVSHAAYYQAATDPALLEVVRELIGDDILLWGARLVARKPGKFHAWHTDIETSAPQGRTVSVWIGLENANCDTVLQVMTRSHRFGASIQQLAHEAGDEKATYSTNTVEAWAQQRDPGSRVVRSNVSDGDALFFDGRLWHGSENPHPTATRTALLLQYATPDTKIRTAVKGRYQWPFEFEPDPPPCLLVGGVDRKGVNTVTTPPVSDPLWPCWIRSIDSIPETLKDAGWTIRPLARGSTLGMQSLKCHVSQLAPGTVPHPPHTHKDEELLVVLKGELELMTGEAGSTRADMKGPIRAGQLAYNAAELLHTMRAVGSEPAEYVVFKWCGPRAEPDGEELPSAVHGFWPVTLEVKRPGRQRHQILGAPTRYLGRLSSHLTVLEPGGGYDPHPDPYDVAIVVLEGTLETLGCRVGPRDVIFYAAQELHGMRNIGSSPSRHLVFEFHPLA